MSTPPTTAPGAGKCCLWFCFPATQVAQDHTHSVSCLVFWRRDYVAFNPMRTPRNKTTLLYTRKIGAWDGRRWSWGSLVSKECVDGAVISEYFDNVWTSRQSARGGSRVLEFVTWFCLQTRRLMPMVSIAPFERTREAW